MKGVKVGNGGLSIAIGEECPKGGFAFLGGDTGESGESGECGDKGESAKNFDQRVRGVMLPCEWASEVSAKKGIVSKMEGREDEVSEKCWWSACARIGVDASMPYIEKKL